MNIDFYNTRIRQAVSDRYVECGRRQRAIDVETRELKRKLTNFMDGIEQLTYREYVDVKSSLDNLSRESRELDIRRAVWDEARELCLNIADEMCE